MYNVFRMLKVGAKNFILFSFFSALWIPGPVFSQNVIIKGNADSSYLSAARSIYAYTDEDFISYKEKELSSGLLDAKGNFTMNFSINAPTYIYLVVDNAKAEMICEPNKTYEIKFLPKDSDAVNTLSFSIPTGLEFSNSSDTELNYLMADFSNRYEAFLEDHRGMIAKKEPALFGKIDTIKTLFTKKYTAYNNSYLNNFIEYTFASLEENVSLKGKQKIYEQYIRGRKIQPGNYDYMAFFHQFFSSTTDMLMKSGKTQMEINSKQIFSSLLELYKQNKFLSNDTLCEMAVLKSLSEYYRYPSSYKTIAVLALLEQAEKQCKSATNRESAENIYKKLSVMNPGKPVSAMGFLNSDGKQVSLSDFKGKYVYLTFWTSWSAASTQEMTLIPDLKKLYGNKIAFISICLDKSQETMNNFLKKNAHLSADKSGYGWTFLYCDNYKKVKEEFNVLTVPAYFMLDPKGNVFKSPAPGPSEIEPVFIKIKKKQQ